MTVEFNPMRSFIYVDVKKEEYRHLLHHWLYFHHIPESISQFEPYCTKYTFFDALPVPEGGDAFGTVKMQLTEHHWLVNIMDPALKVKAYKEFTPMEMLKWQGVVPDEADDELNVSGDAGRSVNFEGCPPFVFAFCPMWWEEDIKGSERMLEDGPNYRWNIAIKYPDGVSKEEGDKWLFEEVFPHFASYEECRRILTSKVMQDINGCHMYRVIEMWFDGPAAWNRIAVKDADKIQRPFWAVEGQQFPYLKSGFDIRGAFILDYPTMDVYSQYSGYIARR